MKPHTSILLGLLFVSLIFNAPAAPVNAQRAKAVVQAWLKADPAPLQEPLGAIRQVREFKAKDGTTPYFVADLVPAGFVVVAGDDLVEPIIAFSSRGQFDPSEATPLGAMVSRDLPGRMAKARALGNAAPQGALLKAKNKWKTLEEAGQNGTIVALGLGSLSEIWVPPFVQSCWSQDNDPTGAACYNYYNPPYGGGDNWNYPCGCVATAMAQLMRYFQHPVAGVGTPSFSIRVDGLQETRNLLGGNGTGGPYQWTNMPLVVNAPSLTERQAIGKLTHDASVSVNASYTADGTSAYITDAKRALTQTFGYSSARTGGNYGANIGAGLNGMLNPNLDAKLPVLLGIQRSGGGHAVVGDGYGYNATTLYHHINLGWGGADNAWYTLPTIDTSLYTYTWVDSAVYNVYTTGTGEIISGRVLKADLSPLANAQVNATRTGGGSYSATTDANGIYALVKLPSASGYTLTASKPGYMVVSYGYTTGTSADSAATSGNIYGANFTLDTAVVGPPVILQQPLSQSVTAGETVSFSVTVAGGAPLYYQWQCYGSNVSRANGNTLTLSAVTETQTGPYQVIVSNASGVVTSTVATLSVGVEMTPTFTAPDVINISGNGPGGTYPSTINVAGLAGVLVKATVTLSNLSHTWPDDLDILLVGPGGQKVMLMSDAGYGYGLAGTTLTFDDTAPGILPDATQIAAGTYRPTDFEPGETQPAPAPAGPYGTSLSVFNNTNPNGAWKLYINDDTDGDGGTLAGGWSMQLSLLASNQVVDHFAWSTISSPQNATAPFAVTLTALDAANHVQSGYGGKVQLSSGSSSVILGNVTHGNYYTGAGYTDGYAFTPKTNITVTHVRHYYGEKVSIWTDAGILLANRIVTSTPGIWVETPLTTPVKLSANTRYRVGVYYAVSPNSYFRNGLPNSFAHVTINADYSSWGDRCPTDATSDRYLLDLRYTYPIGSTPTNAGTFVNGVWTGNITFAGTGTNLTLRAEDKYGHAGVSNPFDVQSAIAPPEIPPGSARIVNGLFQMQLTNLTATRSLVIQTSTNLTNWTGIYTNAAPGNALLFSDPNTSNYPYRFYRALEK